MNKKIFLIFLFAYLLVIPTALAVKIDYSPNDKGVNDMKAHIQDTILFGLIKVREQGTMELKSHKSPTEIVKKNSGWDVNMYYEFNFGELHQEHLGEVEFINLKNNKSINRE